MGLADLDVGFGHFFKPSDQFIASFFSVPLTQEVLDLFLAHSRQIELANFAAIDPKSSQFGLCHDCCVGRTTAKPRTSSAS